MAKGIKQVKPWAYSEGDLRARIKRFSETPEGSTIFGGGGGGGGSTDLSNITGKLSSSYAGSNNFEGDLIVEGSLNISGNLTVDGTTTTVNSTVTTIDDPIMTLGGDTAPGSDDNKDRGIEFRWHDGSSAKVGFFGFDDSTGNFTFIPDATNSSEVFSGNKGTVDVGSLVSVGNISGSGKGYFEKDVEIADDLKVSGSATLGSGASNTFVINSAGRVSGSTKAIFEGDIVTADNLAATGSVSAASAIITGNASAGSATITGKLSSSYAGTNNFEGSLLVETDLLVSGTFTAGTEFVIGSDADGTDRKITFGHSTLKSVIGIDDSGDVFAINTDNAFEAANDLQIDASGHVTLGNGNLIIGPDSDGTDRTITFGHSTLKTTIGIDDSGDVFAINTDNAFEAANDFQIDASGHITLGNGNLVIGADSDGTDRTITFGHSTLKTTVGIDDSSDVFAINTDNAFETANDLQIDTNGNVTLGNGAISVAGNISGSGKGYFEKDVEIADNLKVTGSITAGATTLSGKLSSSYAGTNNFEGSLLVETDLLVSGTLTAGTEFVIGSDADGADRKITFGHSTLKSVIGIDDSGDVFAINTDNAFEAANDLQIDASGHVTLGNGNLIIGPDSDGTDRTITFGHSTLKTTIGIDDSGDVFAINTDNAFEAANDFQIDASGHITLGNGNLVIGADSDGTDRTITFGHSTLKTTVGIDDSSDVFAINTDNAFETANDFQIDASGHVTLGNGNLVVGTDADGTDRTITFGHSTLKTTIGIDDDQDVFAINTDNAFESDNDFEIDSSGNVTLANGAISVAGNISGSGKGYFEKDVEIADNLLVSGSITAGAATLSAKLSSSYAGSNNFEGDLIVEGNLRVSGTTTFGDAAVDLSSFSGKFSSSYAGTNNFEGSLLVETDLLVSGSTTFGNASSDVTTVTGRLSASEGMLVSDDKKLFFGTNNDAYIVYEEGNKDFLVISGSSAGMVLSGTTVQIRGTLQGASPLKIAGGIEIVEASNGETTNMKFGDNLKTTYGDDDDTGIQFRDGALNFMEISGSSKGIVLSGSNVSIDGRLGVGVRSEGNVITHGITLPNTDDVYGKIKANAYTTYSSLRYKDNVEPIQNAMAKIRNLSGVTYNWKTTNSSDIGFIAEEVGKVMPEIVEWESDGVNAQAMDYTKIIPVLVEALKEQQTEIESQKKIINELSEKIGKTKIDKK